jgi:hypothetical protein
MMHHNLKIDPEFMTAKLAGLKPWEIRSEEDRRFGPGDTVTFQEYDQETSSYTGRTHGPRGIIYVHRPKSAAPGYAIFTHT